MNDAERAGRGDVSRLTTSGLGDDELTRLWGRADASHGQSAEAVAELRERKRREQEAPRRFRRRRRDDRRNAAAAAAATQQPTDAPAADERVTCERCKRTLQRAESERVPFPSPADEPVVHLLCSRCADEVVRGLLRLLAAQEPLPAPPRVAQEEQDEPLTIPTRVGWFLLRLAGYALIALAVFALVSWISLH